MHHSQRHIRLGLLAACLLALLFVAGCSTTSQIPDDEQLYIGIKDIEYTSTPVRRSSIRRDSVGVITTIGDAVKVVDNMLDGRMDDGIVGKLREDARNVFRSKEERTAEARAEEERATAERAAFETAKGEVEAVLAYPPNNALFGSSSMRSPLQIGLWVHSAFAGSEGKFGKWINKTFGTQPILVSTVSPDLRAKVAQNTLRNYGFFRGQVGYEVLTQKDPKKARVRYNVAVGPLTRLDSVEYTGFEPVQERILRRRERDKLLRRDNPFSVVDLAAEQARVGSLFREQGYYFWQDAYTTYQADTLQKQNRAMLRVQPRKDIPRQALHPWYNGRTYVSVRRSERDKLTNALELPSLSCYFSGEKPPLRVGMWRHAVSHRRGELFRYSEQQNTLEQLSAMGLFSQMDINYVPRDTSATCDTLDIYVTALLDKPFDSDFEMNATLRSNQQVGPGLSYSLNRRNAFRGGETVSFKIFGSYEWQLRSGSEEGNSLLDSYELGSQLSFKFPRFYAPFIARKHLRFPAETKFALDAYWKRRSNFFTIVGSGVSATYIWNNNYLRERDRRIRRANRESGQQQRRRRRGQLIHELTPLSIEFDKTLGTSAAFDSIMQANPALAVSMRDQFIPSMSYVLTYSSPARRKRPLWLQVGIKEGGNLLSGIYALAGKSWMEADKRMLGSPFAQFLKSTAEIHYTVPLSAELSLATRFYGGAVWAYANSSRAPYAEQFYVGGANSIRGFMVRSIGPGRYRSPSTKYSYIDQTGEVKLEANAELRAHLFGSLHGALFLDVGNVWLLRDDPLRPDAALRLSTLKDIAVGTGLGFRYDLNFLVLRLDLGVGLHAPFDTGHGGFFNIHRLGDMLNLHFAIGYPF